MNFIPLESFHSHGRLHLLSLVLLPQIALRNECIRMHEDAQMLINYPHRDLAHAGTVKNTERESFGPNVTSLWYIYIYIRLGVYFMFQTTSVPLLY